MRKNFLKKNNHIIRIASLTGFYTLLASLGLSVSIIAGIVSPFWPASGLAIALLALWGLRLWPAITIGAVAANVLIAGSPLAVAVGIAAGNTLEALVGAWMLRRLGVLGEISSVRDAAVLLAVTVIAPVPSSIVGALSMYVGGVSPSETLPWICLVWWVGSSLGTFTVMPMILAYVGHKVPEIYPRRPGEFAGAIVLVATMSIFAHYSVNALSSLGIPVIPPAPFIFPPIVWAMLRLRPRDAILVMAIGCTCVVASALVRIGGGPGIGPILFLHLVLMSVGGGWLILLGEIAGRKRIDSELNEQRNQFVELAEAMPQIVWSTDVFGKNNFFNSRWCEYTGMTLEESYGDGWNKPFHPEDRQRAWNAWQSAVSGKGEYSLECRLKAADGSYSWWLVRGVPKLDSNGNICKWFGTCTDIDDIKKLEEDRQKFVLLANSSSEFIGMCDLDLNPLYVNPAGLHIVGLPDMAAACRIKVQDYFFPEDQQFIVEEFFPRVMRNGQDMVEIRLRHFQTGEPIWMLYNLFSVLNSSGTAIGWATLSHDITKRRQSELQLRESEQRWHFAIDGSALGLWDWNVLEGTVFFSLRWKAMLGFDEDEVSNSLSEWESRVHPDDVTKVMADVERHLRGETEYYENEHRMLCKDGSYKWILDRGKVVEFTAEGKPLRMIGTHTDITERKENEERNRIAATAFESQEGMVITDVNNHILSVNQAFTRITGYTAEDVIGKEPHLLSSGTHDKHFYDSMWHGIIHEGSWSGEVINKRKNGEIYTERLLITAVRDGNGEICNYVASITDISQSKAAAEKIHNLAFYDPLTQLANRRLLLDRLQHSLANGSRSNQKGALLFVDIDHFKNLNDTLGHTAGDILLKQVAERLLHNVREGDTVARIGGDEFIILLEGLSPQSEQMSAQTESIVHKLQIALSSPYEINGHSFISTVSIGATLINNYDVSSEDLLKQADIALYRAKDSGRNRLQFFDPKMQKIVDSRVEIENELRIAIEQKQFELYYQIQVDNDGFPIGSEALIRWQHPERGLISPFYFIEVAEDTGLILPIGQWVLEAACNQLEKWKKVERTRELSLSVNVSAKQFHQPDFIDILRNTISRYDIDPAYLKLEITEGTLLENIENIIPQMLELKKIGLRFELDDFGTGYSSLQYLKVLPLTQLKIDQSFVRDIATDSNDRTLVRTIISMAHNLGLKVVAEGVENEDQLKFLKNNGCDHYQGYLFSKPVPIKEFEALLN